MVVAALALLVASNQVAYTWRSTDAGESWQQINDAATGFGTMQVIEGDPKKFGSVYIGTNGRGIVYGDSK